MKKVCVNRLKADVDKLQYFVNSLEHQEDTLEALFQCILRLFDNEMQHGNPCSVHGQMMNGTNGGLLNSQQSSSLFNSKHNISALNLDSVGMSFGKATDDGHLNKDRRQHYLKHQGMLGQSNGGAALIKNMNRQYNSDRNIFRQISVKKDDPQNGHQQQFQQNQQEEEEIESEVVQMGELLRDSNEKKELKKLVLLNNV